MSLDSIQIGDTVVLASGSPSLIVACVTGGIVWVTWENDHGTALDSVCAKEGIDV